MSERKLTAEQRTRFNQHLAEQELAKGTIQKYDRDLAAFSVWMGNEEVCKERASKWKERLLGQSYAPVTVNSMLAAVNMFFKFMGWHDCLSS